MLKITANIFTFTAGEVNSMMDPFRGERSKSVAVSLGLASRYLEMHGGTLSIQPTPEGSAEWSVELPVGQPMRIVG
jgi:hypothetical protein